MHWIIGGALGGVTTYFFGSFFVKLFKFTFIPLVFNVGAHGLYDLTSGKYAIEQDAKQHMAEQRKLVSIADFNFYPRSERGERIKQGWMWVKNDSDGEASNFTPICHFLDPKGGLDKHERLVPKVTHLFTETAKVTVPPKTTMLVNFEMKYHPTLSKYDEFQDLTCDLHYQIWKPVFEVASDD